MDRISQLPPELKEIVLRETVKAKIQDKKRVGWAEAHNELRRFFNDAPFCEIEECYTMISECERCYHCSRNGRCLACMMKNREH